MAQPLASAKRKRRHAVWPSLACAALIAACSGIPNAPLGDTPIRDMANGQVLAPAPLIDRLLRADAILLGEQHDDPEHHRLQAWITRELAARRPVVIAFEMIDESQKPMLDGFLAGHPRDTAALGGLLGWERSGWPDWAANYQPIADAALAQPSPPDNPIVPANLPLTMVREIARNGLSASGLGAVLNDLLNQAAPRDPVALAAHAEDIRDSHCGMLPDSALAPFALAQYARDAVMARSIQAARRENPDALLVLIAGNGHARKDVGVPLHLARLAPDLKIVSLGLIEGEAMPEAAPFDVVWLTPPLAREDPCDAFRKPVQ